MSTTADTRGIMDRLAVQMNRRGIRCAVIPGDAPGRLGLNVYAERGDRYPVDTVWLSSAGFVWGPSFEHTAQRSSNLSTLAFRIVGTMARGEEV